MIKQTKGIRSMALFAVGALFVFGAGMAYAHVMSANPELLRARNVLVDRQHRLEETRDQVQSRIARMQAQVDCMQKQSDWLNSEIGNVKHAIVETDKALASM